MEIQVALSLSPPAGDFNFDSTCSSPYITAPSTPQRLPNFFFSAPTSPSHSGEAFSDGGGASSSAFPFDWEEKPGTPKNRASQNGADHDEDVDEDFAFDFSGRLERISISAADDLFDGGVIRPLKPPPGHESASSVSSPRSPKSKKTLFPLSPRRNNRAGDVDPLAAAVEETTRNQKQEQRKQQQRGSRSLSPIRVSDVVFRHEDEEHSSSTVMRAQSRTTPKPSSSTIASILSSVSFGKSHRKWKLRDLLLFRSASEGRATGKEAIGKYEMLSSKKAAVDDLKNSSFRSTESSGTARKRGPAVSAHEVHYTENRAAAEEMRKRTFLPYKQGLLGCLGFNPGGVNEISRGIGSLTRG